MSKLESEMAYCVIAAVNNDQILSENLATSHIFEQGVELKTMRSYSSAAKAYNAGIDSTEADIIIFAHQDVYLPRDWYVQLTQEIKLLENVDNHWGVLGVYGVDSNGTHFGRCWSSGLGKILGNEFSGAYGVNSIDELVIIIKKASGLRFDEHLPGFHLYGTDIVQTALASGYGAYVIHAPVIHNSNPVKTLSGAYHHAYSYMRSKWRDRLPIYTTVVPLTRYGVPLTRHILKKKMRSLFNRDKKSQIHQPVPGRQLSQRLGFE